MRPNNNYNKQPKVTFEKPKKFLHLEFISPKKLQENDIRFGFWSENANKTNPYGTIQNEFIDYIKKEKRFHTFVVGETMEGKGVVLENIAEMYYLKNCWNLFYYAIDWVLHLDEKTLEGGKIYYTP